MSFSSLRLSPPILRAISDKGHTSPFPIQSKAIPAILSGKDVMAAAPTGTGKTAAFTLPLLQRLTRGQKVRSNHIRVLVLTPTRELAIQVADSVAEYGQHLQVKSAVVYGGVKINPQMMRLRSGLDILVATPGRLLDLFAQNAVKFQQVETLVFDEADRMLDLGFRAEIQKIINLLPKQRQNLLFSATFSSEMSKLAGNLLHRPVRIEDGPRNTPVRSVKQWLYEVDKTRKPTLLVHLLRQNNWQQALVFTKTKNGANALVQKLRAGDISCAAIHGDKSQSVRTRTLEAFKQQEVRILVATDIAARGLDINQLPCVVNFDLPKVAEDYIHRIGRTGRAGAVGVAISLVSADEVRLLSAIETVIGKVLVREVEEGFIPRHSVPLTRLLKAHPKKPKKPKKQKQVPAEDRDKGAVVKGGRRCRNSPRKITKR